MEKNKMQTVSLIYSKCLSDKTGASAVMRLLYDSIPLFEKEGVTLTVIAREHMLYGEVPNVSPLIKNNRKRCWKNRIVSFLATAARQCPLAAYALAYIQSMRPAKKMAKWMDGKINDGEILFFHELYMAYYYLKRYGKCNSVVLVTHDDGRDFKLLEDRYGHFNGSIFHKRLKHMQDYVLSKADFLGFVSKSSTDNFKSLHPEIDNNIIFYSHNGLPVVCPTEHNIGNGYNIVCVGTVIESKGQIFIIEALNRLLKETKDISKIHFTIVGDGPQLAILRNKANEYGLNNNISFVGRQNNVYKYLEKADIFILPSTSEGLPMSILEAMSNSLPIVSTAVGGIPETIIEGKTGLIIDASIDGVYGFLSVIDNYDWIEMGKASYQLYKEEFTVDAMVNSYVEIFNKL